MRGPRVRHDRNDGAPRLALVVLAALALSGCKFVPTDQVKALQAKGNPEAAFDPDKEVAGLWDAKVLPYLSGKAGELKDVRALAQTNADRAGQKYGYKPPTEGAPWTIAVKLEGTIVAANTESRAATIDVDVDGNGKPDAIVQIGPAIRGTALRDVLSFVDFNTFTNQIDFAKFGKSFNTYVDGKTLSKLPRQNLVGQIVTVLGAAPLRSDPSAPLLVTPATITIAPKS